MDSESSENSTESPERLESPRDTENSGDAPRHGAGSDYPSAGESVQDLINAIGDLQIKKGFLLSKLEKQQGQLEIVKHTHSIEPTLRNLCAERFELYKDCVDLGRGVQRLRALYEEIEDSVDYSKNEKPLYDSRNQIRENMASFESHGAVLKKMSRISSAVSSEAARCRKVLRRATISDELQEMLILTMDELNACLESITSTGFSLEELEAMSDVDLQRVAVRDLESQLESLKSRARISSQIWHNTPQVAMSHSNHEFDDDVEPGESDMRSEAGDITSYGSPQKKFRIENRKSCVTFNDDVECHLVPSTTKHRKKKRSLEKAPRKTEKKFSKCSDVSMQNPTNDGFVGFPGDDLPSVDFF